MAAIDPQWLLSQMERVTDDDGVLKVKLEGSSSSNVPAPEWTRGTNALFHFKTFTYAIPPHLQSGEEKSKGGKKGGQGKSDAAKQDGAHKHDHTCSHPPASKAAGDASGDRPIRTKVTDTREDDPDKPFELRIGYSFSVRALEIAVKSMRVGEKARFLCMPEYTEGYVQLAKVLKQERENRINVAKGLPVKTIGGGCCAHSFQEEMNAQTDLAALHGAPLEFEIELIDVQTPNSFTKEPWEMSMMEKFREAPVRKDEGGRLYKEGKYQEALDKYTRALALLESVAMSPEVQDMGRPDRPSKLQGTSSPSKSKSAMAAPAQNGDSTTKEPEIDLSTLEALLQSCRLNYAACKIKLNDFAPVIPACTEVLKTDSENVKAIFRRGQAYSRVGRDLDLAQSDFAKLEDILERKAVPKSGSEWTELRREQQILQGKLKAHTQKEKKMFGRMFA